MNKSTQPKPRRGRAPLGALALLLAALLMGTACTAEPSATTTTPQASESAALGPLSFSHPGGLYEQAFELTLSTELSGVIRYTLDGSDPTPASTAYEQALTIADRTQEENNLSAIVVSGGMGGGMGNFTPPDGQQTPPDGQVQPGTEATDTADTDAADTTTVPSRPGGQRPAGGMGGGGGGMGGTAVAPEEPVFKGTTVKAAVFSQDGEQLSDIAVQSYFVSEDIFTRYGDLAIVSIVADQGTFFDEETGLYTNYNQSGADWERAVHLELYEPDGTQAISQGLGMRLNGNSTRSYAQKSLRFYAKSSYDAENPTIEYEIFPGETQSGSDDLLTSFKRILLRNGGNDNTGTLFRDALMQDLVSDLNVDTQAARPCVAFVNGEFWGVYYLRERYDDHYFANNYGIDATQVAVMEIANDSDSPVVSEGDETDQAYCDAMWAFFETADLTDPEDYAKAQTYVDLDNFIDYQIANIYSGNTDWPANNFVFWRYKTENGGYDPDAENEYLDGRYRWVLKDMDFGFGLMGQASADTLAHATSETAGRGGFGGDGGFQMPEGAELPEGFTSGEMPEGMELPEGMTLPEGFTPGQMPTVDPQAADTTQDATQGGRGDRGNMAGGGGMGFTSAQSTLIFRKLLENEDFLARFVGRFCDVMNTNYQTDYVLAQIDAYAAQIEPAMAEHSARYSGSISSVESWRSSIESMKSYVTQRTGYVEGFLAETFGLGDTVTVSLETDTALGHIRINSTDITEGTKGVQNPDAFTGRYFADTTVTLTAVATEGQTFDRFVVTDAATGAVSEYPDSTLTLSTGAGGITVQAVFK